MYEALDSTPRIGEPAIIGSPPTKEPSQEASSVAEPISGAPTVEESATGIISFEKLGPSLLKPALWLLKALEKNGLRALDPGRFPLWVPTPVEPALGIPAPSETSLSIPS